MRLSTHRLTDIRFNLTTAILTSLLVLMTACGDGGGGASAPDVTPGPTLPNGSVAPPDPLPPVTPINTYATATTANAFISAVTIASPPVVEFTLVDGNGTGLTGLTSSNLRLHIAKLVPAANGNASYWQSYLNRLKTPAVNPANAPAIQGTSEQGGDLIDHGDGTYSYTFATDITAISTPLAVTFEPTLTHRVAMQFSGGPVINPTYDWIPATGATSNIDHRDIVTTESCNNCHDPLALHGGGRVDTKLCVMCHNADSSEPNALASIDLKVMIHKIHRGRALPSVIAGQPYQIYGFRDSVNDYSKLGYPQDIRNCATCHAGTATSTQPVATTHLTNQGDNWAEVPTMEACGSCHDDLDFALHEGGQLDNSGCQSCHNPAGIAGSIVEDHYIENIAGIDNYQLKVLSVTNTTPGSSPLIHFSLINPVTGDTPIDVKGPAIDRLRAALAYSTTDFTNEGSGSASYLRTEVPAAAVDNGDGTWNLTTTAPIPAGATGSGMLIFEGRFNGSVSKIPLSTTPTFFPVTDTTAQPRRQIVSIEKCNACHGKLAAHGGNRTNTEFGCQGCHNPRLASDDNQSLDFKRMIHGIHAADFRETPLVVGTNIFDENEVHFPGRLANCNSCHINDSWSLPLAASVLASTFNDGPDNADYSDDSMISATSSVCSSCHDTPLAQTHMMQNGGDFTATSTSVNSESCVICHGEGRVSDVKVAHGLED